jgi:uncharacterized protein YdaL
MGRHAASLRRIASSIAAIAVVGALMAPTSAAAAGKPDTSGCKKNCTPAPPATSSNTMIVYDNGNTWGYLGQLYGTMTANLVGHFGSYTPVKVTEYQPGQMAGYKAVIYIGSTWDEPIPTAFVDDVLKGTTPVMWIGHNIWALTDRATPTAFKDKYGWMWSQLDQADVRQIRYKGQTFLRDIDNPRGIMDYSSLDTSKVTVLAEALRPDGTSFPWAVRSGNLTYIGENPLTYIGENDRYVILSDLLFDLLAPTTPERHRAMVRLEDVGPDADPQDLIDAADYLSSQGVPFSFGVYSVYKDPNNVNGRGTTIRMRDAKDVVAAINYMISKGGTMIMHGYTHQYEALANPYNGISGDDFEFFTAHVDAENYVRFDGPVPNDSATWALGRVDAAAAELKAARLPQPTIFEFPHYAGSGVDYRAIRTRFTTRYERSLYFTGALTGGPDGTDVSKMVGQFFPYVVNDVYGSKVLPENLGNYEPTEENHHPPRSPQQIIETAKRNLAVRDGFASFFYHPYYGVENLQQTVEGIKALGYTFVSPNSL